MSPTASRAAEASRRAVMELSFAEVVERVRAKKAFGRVSGFYVWRDHWKASPLSARLYCFDSDGELDDDGDRLRDVTELGLRTLLTIGNLEDVIVVRERRAPDSTLEDYVRAVEHYREYDAFEP